MKTTWLFVSVVIFWLASGALFAVETKVSAQVAPFNGKRTKTFTDMEGNVHLTYVDHGNIFYARRNADTSDFSKPIQVNSVAKSAAISELAVGKDGRVHIVYHGNIMYVRRQIEDENRKARGSDIKYTFYSRLNQAGDGFEPQRDISDNVWGFDGGCAIAADADGNVYVFMGGTTKSGKETDRRVFLRHSTDNGDTFSEPRAIDLGKGVCMCCHLKAQTTPSGNVMLAYRVAEESVNRDSYVLTSRDRGKTFSEQVLDRWELRACPGSAYSFVNIGDETLVSWRNQEEVYFGTNGAKAVSPPDKKLKRRVAVLGNNSKGEVLMAWVEGENFNKPHHLRWQLYDKAGQAIGEPGVKEHAFKRWGSAAVYAQPNGDFVILH